MTGVASKRAAQDLVPSASFGHRAPEVVVQRDHTVQPRKVLNFDRSRLRRQARDCRRAINAWNDAKVVACSRPSVRAPIPEEMVACFRDVPNPAGCPKLLTPFGGSSATVRQRQVVDVDMLALRDFVLRKADRIPELVNRRSTLDASKRHFVTSGHISRKFH